jgi:hypothetical protein
MINTGENVGLELINDFTTLYARNNKSKIKTNMRCFPHCCASGHKENGFCGSPIRVKINSMGSVVRPDELPSLIMVGGINCDEESPWCATGRELQRKTCRLWKPLSK